MARDIDGIGGQTNVRRVGGAGPFLRGTLRFADGPNITFAVNDDAPGDEVEVTATVPASAGPPGPTGGTGPNGGPGPAGGPGPGYTSFTSSNQQRTTSLNPGNFTLFFGTGFTWRHASAGVNLNGSATGHVGIGITSITGVGSSTVGVNMEEVVGLVPGQTARVNVSAAG